MMAQSAWINAHNARWAVTYKRRAMEMLSRAREVDPRDRHVWVKEARRHWRQAMICQKEAQT